MLKEELKFITLEKLLDTDKISVRTKNCCLSTGLNTLYDILLYFEKNTSFFHKKIKNAGRKTCEELDLLCNSIIPQLSKETKFIRDGALIQIIDELSEQEQEMLLSLANLILESDKILYEKRKIYGDCCVNNFVVDFYDKYGHLPMFWILEQKLIENNSKEVDILRKTFNVFQNQKIFTYKELTQEYDRTHETMRKIRSIFNSNCYGKKSKRKKSANKNTDRFKTKYVFKLLKMQTDTDWTYLLEFLQKTYFINQKSDEIQKHLKKERCNLSIEFVLQIIAYIFCDKYTLYGWLWKESGQKQNNTYLIEKKFADIFDFDRIKEEFRNKLVDSTSDYLLDLDSYIANSQSWKQFDFDKTEEITNIVKDILLHEFGLYSEDIDGNQIKIPANKERNPSDVVYEILQTKGEPMCLDDIFVEFKKILPKHKYTQEDNRNKLRQYIQSLDNITCRKRSSIYILKEWKHIRSGTIRDTIIEFLLANDLPQTVETITKYVLQHFPETNKKNIHSTMFSGKNFIQFKNGLFGLVNKGYSSDYEMIEQEIQRKTFEQRLTDLEKFIVENEHFPFSSSEDKDEGLLYRWWYRIVNDKQTVSDKQQIEIERIKTTYADFEIDKNMYEWDLNYNKFKMFILENRRVPYAIDDEKFLYDWLRQTKNNFLNNRLSEKQRKKYIELSKLI